MNTRRRHVLRALESQGTIRAAEMKVRLKAFQTRARPRAGAAS